MKKLRITIGNRSYEVTVEDITEPTSLSAPIQPSSASTPATPTAPRPVAPAAQPDMAVEVGAVTSPMAGVIRAVLVKPGEDVKQGRPLVVLEAMKMENQITAPIAGTVKVINVREGDSVQEGFVLLVLE